MYVVSFQDFELVPRFDGVPWTSLNIYESDAGDPAGTWTVIDTQDIPQTGLTDPSDPDPISFTTELATLPPGQGWYKVEILDDDGQAHTYDPIFNRSVEDVEILASVDDVNGNLDGTVIEATADNVALIQVSVARIVRGYLARIVDATSLMTWDEPAKTPDIVREIAAKLIAAQLYFVMAARQSFQISDDNYGQRLYDEAMKLLMGIVEGAIPLPPDVVPPGQGGASLGDLDYWPVDDTGRAFTVGMEL